MESYVGSDAVLNSVLSAPAHRTDPLRSALLPLLFARRDALRVRRVDAEDFDLGRKEGELLEGQFEGAILGVSLDISIKLGRREPPADHVAFELGHVDAISRKPAHGLIE